jgi:hypothetical protein
MKTLEFEFLNLISVVMYGGWGLGLVKLLGGACWLCVFARCIAGNFTLVSYSTMYT